MATAKTLIISLNNGEILSGNSSSSGNWPLSISSIDEIVEKIERGDDKIEYTLVSKFNANHTQRIIFKTDAIVYYNVTLEIT